MKKKVIYQITRHKIQLVEVESEAEEMAVKFANRDFERSDKQEKRAMARCSSLELLYETEGFEIADPSSSVEADLEKQEEYKELYKALKTLTPKQREYVYLRFWKGLTLQQISKLKGVHISTVAESLEGSISRLKKFLKNF